ncbi:MAG TPA: hypothetical protein VND22_01615 [Actinomycetota bacterium]|nr:hypothetical protein [Actinomycetota bacterium]
MAQSKHRAVKRVVVVLLAAVLGSSCGGKNDPGARSQSKSGSPSPVTDSPAPTEPRAAEASARCNPAYSLTALKEKQFAFDGLVTEIGERTDPANPAGRMGTAVFSINEWYKGGGATELTLQSTLPRTEDSVPITEGPDLTVGSRYLVSGQGAFVGTCGFTRGWSHEEGAEWEKAFKT